MKRGIAALLSVLLLFSVILTSCSEAEEEIEEEVNPIEEARADIPQGETVELTIAQVFQSQERTGILEKIIEKYNFDNDDLHINLITANSEEELTELISKGEKIDIAEVNKDSYYNNAESGMYKDLTDYLDFWSESDSLTSSASNSMNSYDNTPYFIPHSIYQDVLYYRSDILEYVDVPRTWQALYEVCDAMQASGKYEYPLAFQKEDNIYRFADTLIWTFIKSSEMQSTTAGYFTKKWHNNEKGVAKELDFDGTTTFSTVEAKHGVNLFKSIYQNLTDSSVTTQEQAIEAFTSGKALMLIADSRAIEQCEQAFSDDEWAIAQYFIGSSDESAINSDFKGWALLSESENCDLAADFLFYLSNSDNNTYWAKNLYTQPIHSDASENDSFYGSAQYAGFLTMQKNSSKYKVVNQPRMYDAFDGYEEFANAKYQEFLNDEINEDELLSFLDEYWSNAYETEGKKWYDPKDHIVAESSSVES